MKKETGLGVPSSALLAAKKPKLVGQTFTPLGRPVDDRGRASPSTHIYHYDEIAKEGKKCTAKYITFCFTAHVTKALLGYI